MMNKNTTFFRYLAYSVEIIILFVLGSTPGLLPEMFGAKPCMLIVLAISIALFEREMPAMIFGLVCGALTDLGFSNAIGFFTISLTLVCFVIGYCANNLIMATFFNVLVCSFVVIAGLLSLWFLFSYVFKGYSHALIYFKNHYISRIVLSFVITPVLYYLNRFIYKTLSDE